MKSTTLITKHCASMAALRLQATSAIWSGYRVEFGPGHGLDARMVEVRG